MKKGTSVSQSRQNVIRLPMDANFFFERAVQSLERHHYEKALKYFRLAVEKEPENPVNYCNLAGVLSEMGRFEESNEILKQVVEVIDPDLVECHYYMANNAANMDCFEEAEQYVLRYLREDPDGEFADEANDMLDMLAMELGRAPQAPEEQTGETWAGEHDRARMLLEDGKFREARKLLQTIVAANPDFYPAQNNLSLAYYYCGDMQQAVNTAESILERDSGNLHALCNLAVFHSHLKADDTVTEIVSGLKKCRPMPREHLLKLATTMGVLEEHETAYLLFRRLLKLEPDTSDPTLLHYAAVASFNTGRFQTAKRFWKQAERLDRGSGISSFFLNHLDEWISEQPTIAYHYHLPLEEQLRRFEQDPARLSEKLQDEPVVRSSFFWALKHGDDDVKLQVIQSLGLIGDAEVADALREFLLSRQEDDYLKRVALFVLRHMKVPGPFKVWLNNEEREVHTSDMRDELPVWQQSWQNVLDCALTNMDEKYDVIQLHDVQALWFEFLRKTYPDVPVIRKAAGWAAALEYVIAKMYGHPMTQQDIGTLYSVSAATVGRHARQIEAVCGVFQRMRSGMGLSF